MTAPDSKASHFAGHRLIREIGRGGMGVVHEAEYQGQRRALKRLLHKRPKLKERFLREARAVAAVDSHPNIVKIHKYGVEDGTPYISFEFIDGLSLDQELAARGPLTIEQCLDILEPILKALAAVHRRGIIHRDLKPANILRRVTDRRHLIADFGLARALNHEALTQTGELLGTPRYMAPEQIDSRHEDYGPHTDIWAVAVILYELLTGKQLFPGESFIAVAQAISNFDQARPKLAALVPDFQRKPALQGAWERALRTDVKDRTQSAGDFLAELKRACQARPRVHAWWPVAASVMVGLVLMVAWLSVRSSRDLRRAHAEALVAAMKKAHGDCVNHFLRSQLEEPGAASPAMQTLAEVFRVHGPQWPASATQRFRKTLLFDLEQCRVELDSSTDMGTQQRRFREQLDRDPCLALREVLSQSQRLALEALGKARTAETTSKHRAWLEQARQQLSKRPWLDRALSQAHIVQCCQRLSQSQLTASRAQSLLDSLIQQSPLPKDELFLQLNTHFQTLCHRKPKPEYAQRLLKMARRLEVCAMIHTPLRRPRLSHDCWQQLLSPRLNLPQAELFVRSFERWRDGHRSFLPGLDPFSAHDWLFKATLDMTFSDKRSHKPYQYQLMRVITAAGECGFFFHTELGLVRLFQSSGALDQFVQEHPSSPWSAYWQARSLEAKPLDQVTTRRRCFEALDKADKHPKTSSALKQAIDYMRVRTQSTIFSYSSVAELSSKQTMQSQQQLMQRIDAIIDSASPYAVEVMDAKLNIFRSLGLEHSLKEGAELSRKFRRCLEHSRKVHEHKSLDPSVLITNSVVLNDRWRQSLVWQARLFNILKRYKDAIATIEGAVWKHPERKSEVLVLLNAYIQQSQQDQSHGQEQQSQRYREKALDLAKKSAVQKWPTRLRLEAQELLKQIKD